MASRALPQQPEGIHGDSTDLPSVAGAVERVREFIRSWGDGRVTSCDGNPLFARDLEALTRAAERGLPQPACGAVNPITRSACEIPPHPAGTEHNGPDPVNGRCTWTVPSEVPGTAPAAPAWKCPVEGHQGVEEVAGETMCLAYRCGRTSADPVPRRECICDGDTADGEDCTGQCCGPGQCSCSPVVDRRTPAQREIDAQAASQLRGGRA